jgi:hypothetical protein
MLHKQLDNADEDPILKVSEVPCSNHCEFITLAPSSRRRLMTLQERVRDCRPMILPSQGADGGLSPREL